MNKILTKISTEKCFNFLEYVFMCLFFFYTILGNNNLTYGTKIISVFMWPTLLLGLIIVLYRIITYKKYIKMPGLLGLVGLLLSICMSTLANYRYSFKDNVVLCIYWTLFFFVLYLTDNSASLEKIIKKLRIIGACFVIYSLLCSLASLYMMFMGVSEKIITADGYEYYQGFRIGRLWGIFINPNNGAVTCAIASAILIYFAITTKRWWKKVVLLVSLLPELVYIALSDSRSGAVCFGVVSSVFFLFLILYKSKNKKVWLKLTSVIAAVFIAVIGFYIPRQIKTTYNTISVSMSNKENEQNNSSQIEEELPEENEKETPDNDKDTDKKPQFIVDRGYDLSGDISNRRFDLWKGAVELFADSPRSVLIGYSFRGFIKQALVIQPENYLVNNSSTIFNTIDNEILNILVAQGVLGIAFLSFLVISVITLFIKKLSFLSDKNIHIIALGVAVCVGFAVSAMFGSIMFYHISQNAFLFWCFLGGTVHILSKLGGMENDA